MSGEIWADEAADAVPDDAVFTFYAPAGAAPISQGSVRIIPSRLEVIVFYSQILQSHVITARVHGPILKRDGSTSTRSRIVAWTTNASSSFLPQVAKAPSWVIRAVENVKVWDTEREDERYSR